MILSPLITDLFLRSGKLVFLVIAFSCVRYPNYYLSHSDTNLTLLNTNCHSPIPLSLSYFHLLS